MDCVPADAVGCGRVVGALAMVGTTSGTRHVSVAGVVDPATGQPIVEDSSFQLASMTKAVTSVAAMQLVERGLLDLDAPIGALLPPLDDAQVLIGFDDRERPILREAKCPITLRHLLSHTSGLGNSGSGGAGCCCAAALVSLEPWPAMRSRSRGRR
jgi:methyl acetate hydrolase